MSGTANTDTFTSKWYNWLILVVLFLTTLSAAFNISGYYLVVKNMGTGGETSKEKVEIYSNISNFLIFIYWTYIFVFSIITVMVNASDLWTGNREARNLNSVVIFFCVLSVCICITVAVLMILAIVGIGSSNNSALTIGRGLWISSAVIIGVSAFFVIGALFSLYRNRDSSSKVNRMQVN